MLVGDSWYEYVAIRTAIAGLRLIAPLSITYCITVTIWKPNAFYTLPLAPLSIWAALETGFVGIHLILRQRLQHEAVHPAPPDQNQRRFLFDRCLATIDDPIAYLRGWFLGAPLSNIGRQDCLDFFAWSFMNKHPAKVTSSERSELAGFISELEERADIELPEGACGANSLRGTFDPVLVTHHPLLWYMVSDPGQ